jgi:hypothetical protein
MGSGTSFSLALLILLHCTPKQIGSRSLWLTSSAVVAPRYLFALESSRRSTGRAGRVNLREEEVALFDLVDETLARGRRGSHRTGAIPCCRMTHLQ